MFSVNLSTGTRRSAVRGIHVRDVQLDATPRATGGSSLGLHHFGSVKVDWIVLADVGFDIPLDRTIGADVDEATALAEAEASYADWLLGIRPVETWVAAFEQLIDSVDGHINFDLFLPIRVLGMRPDTWQPGDRFPVRVNIVNGAVNFAEIERPPQEGSSTRSSTSRSRTTDLSSS